MTPKLFFELGLIAVGAFWITMLLIAKIRGK